MFKIFKINTSDPSHVVNSRGISKLLSLLTAMLLKLKLSTPATLLYYPNYAPIDGRRVQGLIYEACQLHCKFFPFFFVHEKLI